MYWPYQRQQNLEYSIFPVHLNDLKIFNRYIEYVSNLVIYFLWRAFHTEKFEIDFRYIKKRTSAIDQLFITMCYHRKREKDMY